MCYFWQTQGNFVDDVDFAATVGLVSLLKKVVHWPKSNEKVKCQLALLLELGPVQVIVRVRRRAT